MIDRTHGYPLYLPALVLICAMTFGIRAPLISQSMARVHERAFAHNDYEHPHPLWDALAHGFTFVEADIYLVDDHLLVAHDHPSPSSPSLEKLYVQPLDSLLSRQGKIYPNAVVPFYLMIDIKSDADATYKKLLQVVANYPRFITSKYGFRIFLSGNRPVQEVLTNFQGIAVDGRPEDVGKNYSSEIMPVISDDYHRWSAWQGITEPSIEDMKRIRDLAVRVHAEGKKLRLWAAPDNPLAWSALLDAGVDLINTDRLDELDDFLRQRHN